MSQIDWTQFNKRISIAKSMKEVYDCWAIPANISQWFLEKADYKNANGDALAPDAQISAGDQYEWKWHNWDHIETGIINEANGKDLVDFVFGKAGNVKVQLKEIGAGTELTLTQYNIPTDEQSMYNYYVGCSTGWTFWLANLKAWLEHRIKLNATGLRMEQVKDLVNS